MSAPATMRFQRQISPRTKPDSSPGFARILLGQLQGYLSAAKSFRTSLSSLDQKLSKTFGVTTERLGDPPAR